MTTLRCTNGWIRTGAAKLGVQNYPARVCKNVRVEENTCGLREIAQPTRAMIGHYKSHVPEIIINLRQQTTRERKITEKLPDITLRMRVAITGKQDLT